MKRGRIARTMVFGCGALVALGVVTAVGLHDPDGASPAGAGAPVVAPAPTMLRGMYVLQQRPDAPAQWVALDALERVPPRLVVLVHGLDEPGSIWDDLVPALIDADYAVARFEYPNDQSVSASASMLAEAMASLRAAGAVRVDLVCHSMGGLVARDVLTSPSAYAGRAHGHAFLPDVDRLIMIGTPNHGSPWARLRAVAELREQMVRLREGQWRTEDGTVSFRADGQGEAGRDLLPGSPYLEQLNARPMPQDVAITIIAGLVASPESPELSWIEDGAMLRALVGQEEAQQLAEELDRISRQLGDGVVPLESTRLDGVEDVVVLEATHRGLIRSVALERGLRRLTRGEDPGPPPAIDVILDRLARPVPVRDQP